MNNYAPPIPCNISEELDKMSPRRQPDGAERPKQTPRQIFRFLGTPPPPPNLSLRNSDVRLTPLKDEWEREAILDMGHMEESCDETMGIADRVEWNRLDSGHKAEGEDSEKDGDWYTFRVAAWREYPKLQV